MRIESARVVEFQWIFALMRYLRFAGFAFFAIGYRGRTVDAR